MTSVHESRDLQAKDLRSKDLPSEEIQSKDPEDPDISRILAEDEGLPQPARSWSQRHFFVIFIAGSLIFHIGLISFVILFDPTRQLSAQAVEIPVELVSEDQTGPKGGSGQPASEAKALAQQDQKPGGSPPEGAGKSDPAKQATSNDKPGGAPGGAEAKPQEAKPQEPQTEKPQTEKPQQPQAEKPAEPPAQAKALDEKPAENKAEDKKQEDQKPQESKSEEKKPEEKKPPESKPSESKSPAAETKPEPAQKEVAQKPPAPAPEPPKPAEPKAQAAAPKPSPQPQRQAAPQPQQAQAPMQSREEARRALEAAGILPEQPPQSQPPPQPAARQRQAAPMPKFYQPEDKLSLAIPAPMPTDEADSEAVPYKLVVFGMLERVKEYPQSARARHATGHVVISFTIDDNGQPQSIELLRSSGEADLDAEGLAMVARAAPYPVPPAGAQRDFAIDVGFGGS